MHICTWTHTEACRVSQTKSASIQKMACMCVCVCVYCQLHLLLPPGSHYLLTARGNPPASPQPLLRLGNSHTHPVLPALFSSKCLSKKAKSFAWLGRAGQVSSQCTPKMIGCIMEYGRITDYKVKTSISAGSFVRNSPHPTGN